MPGRLNLIREDEILSFAALLQQRGTAAFPRGVAPSPGETYPQRYLQHLIKSSVYYSHVYAHILNQLLRERGGDRSALQLLDYGAGNGLLGLMAVYTGFGQVYLNDQDAGFLNAARQLALSLELEPAGFIEGGIEKVQTFFTHRQPPDLIAGSDVIEHIYDLTGFMNTLQYINPRLICAFSTACNPCNPLQRMRFRKVQLRDEYRGGTPDIHPLFAGQPIAAFLLTRRRIIESYAGNQLTEIQLNELAKTSRGLIKQDIEHAVDIYLTTGQYPAPEHPTNTCDPITGSWSERMLSLQTYHQLFCSGGFSLSVRDGFYNQFDKGKASVLRRLANQLIPISGHVLAPYIVLVGKPLV